MDIIIAGDFVPRNRVSKLIEDNLCDEVFGKMTQVIKAADYSLVNFECPVV